MADLGGIFDSSSVESMSIREPLPAGSYRCVCIKSDWKNSKSGGRYLEFTWQIVDGIHANRMIWSRLNLENSSEQAVKIARSELKAICEAAGVVKLKDSTAIHDVPIYVQVSIETREDNGEPTNRIKGYKSVKDAKSIVTAGGATVVDSASSKPTWM
jgi:Protein of unknown function (DUF669)